MKLVSLLFSALLLAGCNTFAPVEKDSEAQSSAEEFRVPDLQEVYMVKAYESAAVRTTNKMLNETADIYETALPPKLYIKQITKESTTLPDGFSPAYRAINQIVSGSGAYVIVSDIAEADYVLDPRVNQFVIGNQPSIVFKLNLTDKDEQPVRNWNIVVKQMTEDQSWW